MVQFSVELDRQSFCFHTAYIRLSPSGRIQLTGRELAFKVSVKRQPGALIDPYVVDFGEVKDAMARLSRQHAGNVLVPMLSRQFQVEVKADQVVVKKEKEVLVVPREETICLETGNITPESLSKYFAERLVAELGLQYLQKIAITGICLQVNNGEYACGYEMSIPTPKL